MIQSWSWIISTHEIIINIVLIDGTRRPPLICLRLVPAYSVLAYNWEKKVFNVVELDLAWLDFGQFGCWNFVIVSSFFFKCCSTKKASTFNQALSPAAPSTRLKMPGSIDIRKQSVTRRSGRCFAYKHFAPYAMCSERYVQGRTACP